MTKQLMLQIPTDVVRNSNYKLDDKSFTVYAFLLYKKFRAYADEEINVDHVVMKRVLNISDNRTFKRCLDKLHSYGLISEIGKLPTNGEMLVTVHNYDADEKFTQLPVDLLYKIHNIGWSGFRLLYYYESFIIRKNTSKHYCFVAYDTIQEDLKMSPQTVSKYNAILKKNKFLIVTKHEVEVDEYLDSSRFIRYNNHYQINLEQMKKKK